jgi:phosphoserine phosphatase RsbU/P
MAALVTMKGPNLGQRFPLEGDHTLIGRQPDAAVYLESLAVSRHHAQIVHKNGGYVVEDLRSSNGTYVNGTRISAPTPLTEGDTLQVGPYVLALRPDPAPNLTEADHIIRATVEADLTNQNLYSQNPAYKLQVVLEISRSLGHTLELDALLGKLLDQLLRLFPQADRGMVVLCERDRLVVRAQRSRREGEQADYPFSRTVVNRALTDGTGILSEDVPDDKNLVLSATLLSLNLHSFLCVPLIGWEGRRLGVIQLDCTRPGAAFRAQDLETLTAVGLQVAVALENAAFYTERLREERLRQEVALAREIQQAFLPDDFAPLGESNFELFARVHPAREVSGDLYDFFPLKDGRLVFFLGDVSGKGMPAALFMIAVRTLARHLAASATGPADMLTRLNKALVADNPTALFVTLAHGLYDPRDGSLVFASGGHPAPLLRRVDGKVEPVAVRPGLMLGCSAIDPRLEETRLVLAPGETFILYTDGLTEAFAPDGRTMFDLERLCEVLGGPRTALSLEQCAEEVSAAVSRFTGQTELQDDQSLFMLRRR